MENGRLPLNMRAWSHGDPTLRTFYMLEEGIRRGTRRGERGGSILARQSRILPPPDANRWFPGKSTARHGDGT